ncbi:MAG: hypothetical protein NTU93_18625 [Arthrobacter sp.]|nr:hypothetical protein [Arthrobacter sp.]
MVTTTNGTLVLSNGQQEWPYNIFISDVVNAYVTFSVNGLAVAGSQNFIIAPANVWIKDIAMTTGPTVAKALVAQANEKNCAVMQFTNILDTLQTRSFAKTGFANGAKITLQQV